ncbi:type VI secretion system protein TssA [Neptunomonas phycophila]|jgi:type VI secretion system protein ImpA|uniref:type VI secretion system protein TssA n=1 Tax=Neptunomonas phycophila TaxID=1572645 RepID=UPI0023F7DBD7|nr:type VI secretion system protein TssA [Neptunomonas phycophila]MDO6782825.1 type VI secretion system protein TssA [Neptunomonas phycophila]
MDFSAALTPINADVKAGFDIRNHPEYADAFYELRDLRNAIRAQERRALSLEDLYALGSEWKQVQTACVDILATQSKDVEVLAWLAEATIRVDGFVGLAEVFDVIDQTLREYWGGIYPLPDEEGISATLFPLTGLNGDNGEGTLVMPIRMASVITTPAGEMISGWDYIKACDLAQLTDDSKRQRKIDDGIKTIDQLQQLMQGTDSAQIKTTARAIDACKQNFASIDDFLQDQCGYDSPPTSAIKNVLSTAWDALAAIARIDTSILEDPKPAEEEASELEDDSDKPEVRSSKSAQNTVVQFRPEAYYPSSREEALIMVSRLSAFFRDTEPHSPLSYQMERVERWGRMGLAELMDELLDDDTTRHQFFRLIGLSKDSN